MKKIVLLLILILSTGCTINYNLTIDEVNNFEEDFAITSYETIEEPKASLYALYEEEYPIYIDQEFAYYNPYIKLEDFEYYEKSYSEIETGYIFNYKSSYEQDNYYRARSLNTVYKNSNIGFLTDTDTYYISTSNPIIFVNNTKIEQITINITFNNTWNITNHNADQVNNNTYTWILTRDNNRTININYQEKEVETPPVIEDPSDDETITIEPTSNNNVIYIMLGIFCLITIILVSINIKKKRL